ncbi:hypothetical protein CKAN_00438500 [Cinnamomum micranthum f. kanehirae]|uniref:Uncharacterized protein n=1 Tax=Cinnamomum micranthum f. kanehirae TaxID=337451 RepID=A0A443NBT5_9MAGN|nr:hypothetical protein CKAN_00438500 [Cinnamomum micranthum f. kanehirae]
MKIRFLRRNINVAKHPHFSFSVSRLQKPCFRSKSPLSSFSLSAPLVLPLRSLLSRSLCDSLTLALSALSLSLLFSHCRALSLARSLSRALSLSRSISLLSRSALSLSLALSICSFSLSLCCLSLSRSALLSLSLSLSPSPSPAVAPFSLVCNPSLLAHDFCSHLRYGQELDTTLSEPI